MEAKQIVVFKLEGHDFGIDIKNVLEILSYEPIRPVPAEADYVEGILNVRGKVYTIFSLRKRLLMPSQEKDNESKIILLHLEKYRVGFLVDQVAEILNIDELEMEEKPEMIDTKHKSCIEGIVKQEDRMIIVLDVNKLITSEGKIFVQGVSDEHYSSSDAK